MPTPLKTIFFDIGNTLLFPDRAHILKPIGDRRVTLDHWHAIERDTKRKFDDAVQHGGPADSGFWQMFYAQLLDELHIRDANIHASLVEATRHSANWCEIHPGTCETLQRIGQR